MIVAGLDTATRSTVAGVLLDDGRCVERREDPPADGRPGHAGRLLELAEAALEEAGAGWPQVDRIAVGVGPGGFTGLRIGIATARALAQAHATALVGVSTLRALSLGSDHDGPVVAVIDARRGEAFAAAWGPEGTELVPPAAYPPEELAARVEALPGALCAGDGAVRFRAELERAGAAVPPDGSPLHLVRAEHLCRLGAAGEPAARDTVLPDYRREPDAKPPRVP
jgi:tRNA threonylcarbamoyladenosine biosynthesis protein TsaB